MRGLLTLSILFLFLAICSSEAMVTLTRTTPMEGCIIDGRAWAVTNPGSNTNNGDPNLGATNAQPGAWLAGIWNFNNPYGQPPIPSNGIINLRFQIQVAPTQCNLQECDYTCHAEYYNRSNDLQGTTNYPGAGITRTCGDDWYSFHPGYAGDTNAWVITDNTVDPNALLAGLRGKSLSTLSLHVNLHIPRHSKRTLLSWADSALGW